MPLSHYENTYIQIYRKNHLQNLKFYRYKNSEIFHISAQNIDCGHSLEPPQRGGSNEYPQSMLFSIYQKNNVYPSKPQFYYIKVGFKGVKMIYACFVMVASDLGLHCLSISLLWDARHKWVNQKSIFQVTDVIARKKCVRVFKLTYAAGNNTGSIASSARSQVE